ncbi:MAG: Crp/Fnr family transcriptional regulator [Acetobacteraceae bacterium]|nr:Crp/Fnr family transcriptional regulator [Acetobacteraceae bacterium]
MLDEIKVIEARAVTDPDPDVTGNRLLRALGRDDLDVLVARRPAERMAPGQVLIEPSTVAREVIFPLGGTVLSSLALMPGRKPVETALVGSEGAAGALFGPRSIEHGFRVQVLTGGLAVRIAADRFGAQLELSPELRGVMGGYAMALLAQVQIGVACAALHPVEARAARWMLDLLDRLGERALPLTQEALADLLGVRRTTITRVVATLEERGLVRHRRGRIIVVDRAGLEAASCACHERAKAAHKNGDPGRQG